MQQTTPSEYIFPSTDDEARRLEGQARLYGGVGFLAPFFAAQPRAVLDVGCGSGHFTRHAAARCPTAEVIGLDLDASRIAFARAQPGAGQLCFEHGDMTALPFAAGRFDLVFNRFALVHLRDPLAALREMARVTRPGGRVVAFDMVHEGIWFSPPKPALERVLATTIAILRERGAEPNQGLHLAVGLQRAGLQDVVAEVLPHAATSWAAGDGPGYEAYRENWAATVRSLAAMFGARFEAGLVDRALQELAPSAAPQLMVEITVLAHGVRGDGPPGSHG
jgi:SAM-dependent methyltransferase